MRLVSFSRHGVPGAGTVHGDAVVPFAGVSELSPDNLEAVLAGDVPAADGPALALSDVVLRPVVPRPGKVVCVGLNYRSHVEETARDMPEYPVLFTKFAGSLTGPYDDIPLPEESDEVDYEAEVAVIVGRPGRRIAPEDAHRHIAGYAVANDVTMRDFQYKTHQWLQGKAWDRSTPLGPWLTTPDELGPSPVLAIELSLNGEVLQRSDTSRLIFDVPALINAVSRFAALEAGDVILTGTPGGVGYRRDPQVFLRHGDVVDVAVPGLGALRNKVVSERLAAPPLG